MEDKFDYRSSTVASSPDTNDKSKYSSTSKSIENRATYQSLNDEDDRAKSAPPKKQSINKNHNPSSRSVSSGDSRNKNRNKPSSDMKWKNNTCGEDAGKVVALVSTKNQK